MTDQQIFDQFDYEYYCAESEFNDTISYLSSMYESEYLTESEMVAINEGAIRAIRIFLSKTMHAIQLAWNRFKGSFGSSDWNKYREKHSQWMVTEFDMQTPTSGFTFPIFDKIEALVNIKPPEWSDSMDCSTKEGIWEKYFSDWYSPDGTSLKDNINKKCFRETDKSEHIKNEDLRAYINFMDKYSTYITKISNIIDICNKSGKTFEALEANPLSDNPKPQAQNSSARYIGFGIPILEADGKDKSQSDSNNTGDKGETTNNQNNNSQASTNQSDNKDNKFTSASSSSKEDREREKAEKRMQKEREKEEFRVCKTYFDSITQMFSAVMSTVNKARTISYRIIINFVTLNKAEHGGKSDEDRSKEEDYVKSQQPEAGSGEEVKVEPVQK